MKLSTPLLVTAAFLSALGVGLAVDISNMPDTPPAPEPVTATETYNSAARQPAAPEQTTPYTPSKSGTLCVGMCMGPHLNLSSGKIEIGPSFGPGLQF